MEIVENVLSQEQIDELRRYETAKRVYVGNYG